MSMNEVCHEIRDLLPSYAVNALEPGERAYVRRHLSQCPDCQRELREFEAVAEGLLHATAPVPPPSRLRERIDKLAAAERQREDGRERQRDFPLLRLALVAGVAAVLVVNLLLWLRMQALTSQARDLQLQIERNQIGLALGTYPTKRVVELQSDQVFGTVLYDPERPLALLYVWGLEPLPADRAYQVWLKNEAGERTSGGLFQSETESEFTLAVIRSPVPLRSFAGLGVTVEPVGGSPGPSGDPVFTARFQ